jgi:hypothetical protein
MAMLDRLLQDEERHSGGGLAPPPHRDATIRDARVRVSDVGRAAV